MGQNYFIDCTERSFEENISSEGRLQGDIFLLYKIGCAIVRIQISNKNGTASPQPLGWEYEIKTVLSLKQEVVTETTGPI